MRGSSFILPLRHTIFNSRQVRTTVKPVLSEPHIKRIPCIQRTSASVNPNFFSHIFCKTNLYKTDTSKGLVGVRLRASSYEPANRAGSVCLLFIWEISARLES